MIRVKCMAYGKTKIFSFLVFTLHRLQHVHVILPAEWICAVFPVTVSVSDRVKNHLHTLKYSEYLCCRFFVHFKITSKAVTTRLPLLLKSFQKYYFIVSQ